MVHAREPLGVRCQNKKAIKRKPRPQWDGSINDVESMKLSKSEVEKRTKLYSAKHMEKIRNEIKTMQRKEKSLQSAIHSSPFVAHNRSIVVQEATDTKSKLQELLNETDRKMAEAKDMFGDHGYKYRVIPNVTSAPRFNHSPISLARTMVDESPSPPTALNDTQKLGVVTVETLPPDTTTLDLTRIRQLLNQEKENCLLTAQNTLINSNLVNTATAVKINKVLDFNEDIPSVRMADRSRRKVRIGDTHKAAAAEESEARDHWSSVPVEVNSNHVVMSSKPEKRNSFEASPPRLRESSSESLVSPSRIKKQQSLKKSKSPKSDGGSPAEDDKTKTKKRTPEKKPTSPVQIVSKSAPQPPHSAPPADSASPTSAPKLGDSFTEHRYPPLLKVPAIKEDEDSPIDNGAEEVDPIRASRSPSGRKLSSSGRQMSPRNNLVNTATSPVPTPRPVSTHSMATSPVRALQGPVKGLATEKKEGNHSYDRQYTDQELKDRLESLIVGGHYPFARVEQKSYAIADPDGNKEEKDTDKQVGTWIRANFPSEGENLTFEDSSPLKGAALDLELKLRKYQSQIGDKPNKKNAPMGGFSGYTSLLLRSVSTMIGYLTDQEGNTLDERGMRSEVIETMSALQNTVETLSTELLSCRKDLSETKQKVQVMEQDYSSTLMFLIDNCVLKDPSLQTPLRAQRIDPLPTVISPFTKSPPQPPPATTPDLLTFTPHPNKSENLMEFTPGQADGQTAQTDSLVQITPETSEQYLQYLEEKTEALRSGLDDKINKMNKSADKSVDRSADKSFVSIESESPEKPEIIDNERNSLLAQNKSNLSCMNFSNLTEDGLDLSQDLDALIDRLKQMNAQTLAVTSQQMGLTPRKADAEVIESVKNIKDLLDVEQTKPQEAATRVIESYNRQSDFSPSQLLHDVQESTPNSDSKHSKCSSELSAQSLHPAEVSPIFISPPDVNRASGRISGEYIGSFSGTEPVAVRPLTPNPLSPRRVEEEIRRSTPDGKISGTPPNETHSVSSSPPGSPCLEVSFSDTSPTICRSYSSILQSPSAFSPPTKEGNEPSSTESSPKHDKTAMINDFLSHNPHYLKKISESLTSASLPSFPTSPTQVSTARLTKDDGVPNETEKSPFVKPTGGSPGVSEAVVSRGSVFKNIAKFEKKLEEAELERERSISPKRSPTRRGKGSIKRAPRSALSPERKPNSPKVKHRVSWEGDLNDQDSPPPKNNTKPTKGAEQEQEQEQEEESEIVMKPDRSLLPERRIPEKPKEERRVAKKTVNGRKSPEDNTNGRAPEKAVQGKRAPEKKKVANGSHPKNGSTPSAADPKAKGNKDTLPSQKQGGDDKSTGNREPKLSSQSSGSDLMDKLMSMNDAKLTELVTTLNKLTER